MPVSAIVLTYQPKNQPATLMLLPAKELAPFEPSEWLISLKSAGVA